MFHYNLSEFLPSEYLFKSCLSMLDWSGACSLIGSKVALQFKIEGKAVSCGNKVYQTALLPVI